MSTARRRLGVVLLLDAPVADEVDGLRKALGDTSFGRIPAHLTLVPPVNVHRDGSTAALARLRAAASRPARTTTADPRPGRQLPPRQPGPLSRSRWGSRPAPAPPRRRVCPAPQSVPVVAVGAARDHRPTARRTTGSTAATPPSAATPRSPPSTESSSLRSGAGGCGNPLADAALGPPDRRSARAGYRWRSPAGDCSIPRSTAWWRRRSRPTRADRTERHRRPVGATSFPAGSDNGTARG